MDARGPTSESTEEIILCIGVALTLSLSTAGQDVLREEHLLTHMAAVIMQRGSRTLLTASDKGGLWCLEYKMRRIGMVNITNMYSEDCTSIHEE